LAAVGAILAAAGAAVGFFVKRYWDKRDRFAEEGARKIQARDAERQQQREILYESLKWFEGGTQNRSIGIAVVTTSWQAYPEFRELWIEVVANQAIYLLTGSKQGEKAHEHDNLRRMLGLLVREATLLTKETKAVLCATIQEKLGGTIAGGLTLTPSLRGLLKKSLPAFSQGSK